MTAYPDKDVFVFEKTDAAERFLILVNIRNVSNIIQVPENWRGHEVDDEVTRKHTKLDENFELAPFEYMIFAY
jgi:hypothetical protein